MITYTFLSWIKLSLVDNFILQLVNNFNQFVNPDSEINFQYSFFFTWKCYFPVLKHLVMLYIPEFFSYSLVYMHTYYSTYSLSNTFIWKLLLITLKWLIKLFSPKNIYKYSCKLINITFKHIFINISLLSQCQTAMLLFLCFWVTLLQH